MKEKNVEVKLKLLAKLFSLGYRSEKEITSIPLSKMLELPKTSIEEIRTILKLQEAIKSGKVISFLSEKSSENNENGFAKLSES